jgi:pyruvate/2-oxoglutarate/acetoin dehydrogenase E1 component
MAVLDIVQSLNRALRDEMKRDSTVLVLGEDVGKNGGVFRVTEGLQKSFGVLRAIDTPLAESAIIGVALGLAMNGMRPVAEIQFSGFLAATFDQLINHVSRVRWRTCGRFSCPLVIRVPYGGGIRALEHHSDSFETYVVHTPGLKVVVPSTPYDAKGLLTSAIRDPDPVIFFEPLKLYRSIKQDVPFKNYTIPLGRASVVREGTEVTMIAYGAMVHECLKAAEVVQERYTCEVIDLRTLKPLDMETVSASVEKTGRAIVVHEAQRACGVGAEVASQIMERNFLHLQAPVMRVTGFDTILPLPHLEKYFLPNAEKIVQAIEKVMSY